MSFWGGLGKILLKAAPIAANFIPGIGPLASMAISGATSGLSKKLEGGSWLDALKAGGIGAGASYAGGKIPIKGLGPSDVRSTVGAVNDKLAGGGITGALGNIGKGVIGQGTGWQGALGKALSQNIPTGVSQQQQPSMGQQQVPQYAMNYGNSSGMGYMNPDVGGSIDAGINEARKRRQGIGW